VNFERAANRRETCHAVQEPGAASQIRAKELAGFLKARDNGRPSCQSVRAAGRRLLQEMDDNLARLHEARQAMAVTLAAWDARLERTPAGTPAHLLTMVPDAPRATRRGLVPKQRKTASQ